MQITSPVAHQPTGLAAYAAPAVAVSCVGVLLDELPHHGDDRHQQSRDS